MLISREAIEAFLARPKPRMPAHMLETYLLELEARMRLNPSSYTRETEDGPALFNGNPDLSYPVISDTLLIIEILKKRYPDLTDEEKQKGCLRPVWRDM